VMGGIADYSGTLVLELPLARATWAVVQRQDAPICDVVTRRDDAWHFFSAAMEPVVAGSLQTGEQLAQWFADRDGDRWPAYVLGVVQRCAQRAGLADRGEMLGFRLLIESTVPEGKGVASSAALEVAVMAAVAAACGDAISPSELAVECQWVENHIVGAPCGIMDQMTSACGRRDRLLRLRCQPGTIEGYVDVPDGYRFYGIDSGVRHAVTGDDYSTVRTAAFMGYRMIAELAGLRVTRDGTRVRVDDPRWRGSLANLTPAEFSARFEHELPEQISGAQFLDVYGGITDSVTAVRRDRPYRVRQATAHPIHEQQRVERFAQLLGALPQQPGVGEELGHLMYASHASYGACGLGSEGTDRLVELVATLGAKHGLFGAKITGGGSGGTVAVLGTDTAAANVHDIARRYTEETGRPAEVFTESGPGAGETGVLVVQSGEWA
jgi:galactokinase